MLLCITLVVKKVGVVVGVKKVGVVAESSGVPQVTLKFPPSPPKTHILFFWIVQNQIHIVKETIRFPLLSKYEP